jgi:hypothetical protein
VLEAERVGIPPTGTAARAKAVMAFYKHRIRAREYRRRGRPDRSQPAADRVDALILESLANPAHLCLAVFQRCEVIGIARSTWYQRTRDPTFKVRCREAFEAATGDFTGPVFDALVATAMLEGRDGDHARKLFFQLNGMHTEGVAGVGNRRRDDDEQDKVQGAEMTDQELLGAFEGREHAMPPGILRRLGRDPDAASDRPAVPHPPYPPPDQEKKRA